MIHVETLAAPLLLVGLASIVALLLQAPGINWPFLALCAGAAVWVVWLERGRRENVAHALRALETCRKFQRLAEGAAKRASEQVGAEGKAAKADDGAA